MRTRSAAESSVPSAWVVRRYSSSASVSRTSFAFQLLLEGVGDQPVFGPDQHELSLRQLRLLASAVA